MAANPDRTGGAPLTPPDPAEEVAVWWLATDAVSPTDLRRWRDMLDPDERARAARFHFELDRREFIAAHVLLRALLSSRADAPARAWRFLTDEYGKPRIDPSLGRPDLSFSLSHTRGLVAVAAASHGAIGVDVERIDAGKADDGVAEAYFAPSEAELLRRTPVADRAQCFFRLWTLKEAYVKAMSVGLSMRLDSFAFSLDPIRIRFPKGSSVEARDWRFATLPTTGEHVLSLAMRHPAGEAARLAPRALAPGEV